MTDYALISILDTLFRISIPSPKWFARVAISYENLVMTHRQCFNLALSTKITIAIPYKGIWNCQL